MSHGENIILHIFLSSKGAAVPLSFRKGTHNVVLYYKMKYFAKFKKKKGLEMAS